MNEKGLVVLEQYELDEKCQKRKGILPGGYGQRSETVDGVFRNGGRLEFQAEVMGEQGKRPERLDFPVRNKEGGFW